jgi:predicted RNase H-like nuclease (RuvC/YqgF family)
MTQDRTYYRACSTRRLIEDALSSDHEMAIALGERLEEYDTDEETIADLLRENKELDARVDDLRREIESLTRALEIN